MRKQTKTNHSHPRTPKTSFVKSSNLRKATSELGVRDGGRDRTVNSADKNIQEEMTADECYKKFSIFWEKARDIRDEDGDKILEWDKSNIANFCFSEGLRQGKEEGYNNCLAEVEKMIDIMIGIELKMKTDEDEYLERARALEILSDIKQKLQELKT